MDAGRIVDRNKSRYFDNYLKMSKKILSISFCCCFLKGLGFRPLPEMDNVESTLIWYKGTHHENYKQWTDSLDEFLAGKLSKW